MGGYFSKDYYTNEEKVGNLNELSTTPKFRILKDDPRSASLGILRTPIQVEVTPKRPVLLYTSPPNITGTTNPDKECVGKEHSGVTGHGNTEKELEPGNAETSEINNKLHEEEEMTDKCKNRIKSKPLVRRYLETNLDDFITSPLCDSVLINEKSKDLDSRSVTEVSGLQVSSVSPYTDHTTTLLDVSDFTDDPSAIVTDNDNSFVADSEIMNIVSINTWLAQMENEMSHCSLSEGVSPQKSMDDLALQSNGTANKKLFSTPDAKTSSTPEKARTPLQEVRKNLLFNSPSSVIKRKQWRCIQEERAKRGLSLDDENTPPPMPPFSNVPASAPGKLMQKKRIAEWDKDSTVFI